jgi:S-methylmethionine-dependent homocysteine/selenocysteine methylase
MAKYRNNLPQLSGGLFLTDGGLETTLIFHNGFELPLFAAFDLLKHDKGRKAIADYYRTYISVAQKHGTGFILESATWRASSYWGDKLGYSREALSDMNRQAIELLSEIREEYETDNARMPISGCIGPRGDAYNPVDRMNEKEAEQYHKMQIEILKQTDADFVSAFTMSYAEEAIGLSLAAKSVNMPVVISFTVETDGRLPSGQSLKDAIETVDSATDSTPVYYMINCAHPVHFENTFNGDESWQERIRGIRANASTKSHAELDEAEELDDGNPAELGKHYEKLRDRLGNLNILGGCCGTDHRHIEEICSAFITSKQ